MIGATEKPTAQLIHSLGSDLPPPGGGSSAQRLRALHEIARTHPLSVARLVEAHTDALAILLEAGRAPIEGAVYGVWASQTTTTGVSYDDRSRSLTGSMGFASGLGIVDRALLTARGSTGTVLLDVAATGDKPTISFDLASWATPALAGAATGPVHFNEHSVDARAMVGEPGWYLRRPGFWHGACAPAACWAGGAAGLVDAARLMIDDDPHRQAHFGAMVAHEWTLTSLLDATGQQIDDGPDLGPAAELCGRALRFTVASICRDTLDRFGRAFGPRPYVQRQEISQRAIDLDLYIKQHHAERELPELGDLRRNGNHW